MIELTVYDRQGKELEKVQFDDSCLGKFINMELLHRAVVMYEANQRTGTHSVMNARRVTGSTRKPFKQKGTGRARQGFVRRVGSRGGAIAHGPRPRDYRQDMPRKARQAALRSALLGKFRDGEVVIVNELTQAQPKTKDVAATLKNLKIAGSCLVVVNEANDALVKSVRNIAETGIMSLRGVNAYEVLRPKQLLMTKDVLSALQAMAQEVK